MAGKIIADTIETGAGADISTSYVVNGSAKAWVNFNGTGTIAFRDSFNHSSLSDAGTGKYDISITSSMNNDDYSLLTGVGRSNSNYYYGGDLLPSHFLTSGYSLSSIDTAGTSLDFEVPTSGIHGDLA